MSARNTVHCLLPYGGHINKKHVTYVVKYEVHDLDEL